MNNEIAQLSWELSVLQRAVAYPNLSAASRHIGISQPQISRILQKLEETLELNLLDRRVKRQPLWTPEAHSLAEAYNFAIANLDKQIRGLGGSKTTEVLRLATLEGLARVGLEIAEHLLSEQLVHHVHLDVLDLRDLSQSFEAGDYSLIISSHRSSRRKNTLDRRLGYQTLQERSGERPSSLILKSTTESLEITAQEMKRAPAMLISNSLHVRELAFQKMGGRGVFPSPLYKKSRASKAGESEVLLLVRELLAPGIMDFLESFEPQGR